MAGPARQQESEKAMIMKCVKVRLKLKGKQAPENRVRDLIIVAAACFWKTPEVVCDPDDRFAARIYFQDGSEIKPQPLANLRQMLRSVRDFSDVEIVDVKLTRQPVPAG